MRLRQNTTDFDLTQIVDHAFSYTVKGDDSEEHVHSIKVEAANTGRRGGTQLLVRKWDEKGHETIQWVDLNTFSIWWQLYGQVS